MGETTPYGDALALEREGDFPGALRDFRECLADPTLDEGDLHFHCGWCIENQGNNTQAVECYIRAAETTRIKDVRLNSYFRAGWVLMQDKEIRKAADMFRFAIEYSELVQINNQTSRHAMFWFAHCLELQGQFLEALKWYRIVEGTATELEPESRLRQIMCLVSVGSYEQALDLCNMFAASAPDGFDEHRYRDIRAAAGRERKQLEQCLKPHAQRENGTYAAR